MKYKAPKKYGNLYESIGENSYYYYNPNLNILHKINSYYRIHIYTEYPAMETPEGEYISISDENSKI